MDRGREIERGGLQQATILDQDERDSLGAVEGGGAPRSEGFLVGRQVLLRSLVSFQGFYSIHVLRQLRLPPHQNLFLLDIFQPL